MEFPSLSFAPPGRAPAKARAAAFRMSAGMIHRLVALGDAAAILLAAVASQWLPGGGSLSPPQTLVTGLTAASSFVLTLKAVRGYRMETYRSRLAQIPGIVIALATAALADRVLVWTFAPDVLDQNAWLLAWTAATLVMILSIRQAIRLGVRTAVSRGVLQKRVVVIGATPLAERLLHRLAEKETGADYRLVGVFDPAPRTAQAGAIGSFEDFGRLARAQRVDLIVIAQSWDNPGAVFELVERVQWVSADVMALLDDGDRLGRASQRVSVAGLPALKLSEHPLRGSEGLAKAALDYAVAALALFFAAPLMVAAATAVRLSSPGPVLFRQTRTGFNGKPFDIYKFRTMTVDPDDDGSRFKARGDSRITRVGAFLRQTSLDELPQLFNVLRGEMSMVGPRPHVPNMNVGAGPYAETVRTYAGRCQIKPGITGWAQINGMRGGIDTVARRGVELDLDYIRNWSLALDLEIMMKTLTRHMMGSSVF
jgi:putative colanic acid biosynthesis UDP-glucose lipid carrier transferase